MRNNGIYLAVLLLTLTGCGSTPSAPKSKAETIVKESVETRLTAEDLLSQAEASENPATELIQLIQLVAQTNCAKAIEISHLVFPRLTSDTNRQTLAMTQGECLVQLGHYRLAESLLADVKDESQWLAQKHQLLFQIYSANEQWWQAANSLSISTESSMASTLQIWELLQQLTDQEISQYSKEISVLNPLLQLLKLQRNLTVNYAKAYSAIREWQVQYPEHHFAQQLPESLRNNLQLAPGNFQNILVMLPLSGARKSQGEAIKEGILAAHFSSAFESKSLHFVDTATWQESTLELPEFDEVDLVIGPLLKENIDQVLPLIPEHIPVLFLNRTDTVNFNNNHYFYSLAPEDEALQLAELLKQKGLQYPMLIAADTPTFQRMKQAFTNSWQASHKAQPVTLDFSDNNAVREGVNQKLALSDSENRVQQIRNLLRPEVHSFERNRRDIDAIIVFANATQTELINPLIEASISPFAEIIPVYATSRSYSRDLSENDLRDLRNLFFIEMPWMIGDKDYAWMRKRAEQLWPGRRDVLQRLFAMGYDALNIAPHLTLLATLENQSWQGLTGTITLDKMNQTQRKIIAAQFNDQEVKILVSD